MKNKEETTAPELEINPNAGLEEAIAEAKSANDGMPVPTPEEVKLAEQDFHGAVKEWETVTFELSPSPKIGQNFIDYIRNFMDNKMMWTQNAWMGAIKLEEELIASEVVYNNGKKKIAPIIGYQALEFIIYILNNPGGTGLASAKEFEADAEQHVVVLQYLERQLESARKSLDHIKWLQEKWAAYEQGYFIEKEPTDDEMPEGAYFDKEADKFLAPGDKGYDINEFIKAVKDQYGDEAAEKVVTDMKADEQVGPDIETIEINKSK